ncbi:tyrosine-type recombinase/integrase [Vibrio breoganii]
MLTVKSINSLKSKTNPYYVSDNSETKGKGRLVVQVMPSGKKSFKFRYFENGKPTFILIGMFPSVSLSEARDTSKEYSSWLDSGLLPKQVLADRAEQKKRLEEEKNAIGSLKQLLHAHADHKKKNGKRNYQVDLDSVEKDIYKFIDPNKKANEVTPRDLIPCLAEMINRGAATKANKIRSILHAAFNFGSKYDNDPANYSPDATSLFNLTSNPVSAIPKQTDAEKAGDHFLSFDELEAFLSDLKHNFDNLSLNTTTRDIITLCFHLGGQRPYEVVNTLWTDIDWKNKVLNVRKEVFKTNKPHAIPLTKTALSILRRRKKTTQSRYVFSKKTNLDEPTPTNTIAQAVKYYRESHDIRHFTPRDFRRTFKTLGAELGLSKELRDRIQGHSMNDVSSKHYDRYDYLSEKRVGLEIWEKAIKV